MADTPDIKLENLDEKKKSDLSNRTLQENKVDSLLVKLIALKTVSIKYDLTRHWT